jgi:hypothetical protein
MENDRILNILRWVVTPIALALIASYFQMRTAANTAQTKASYETLAPSVLELQDKVAVLAGRVEELSKRPVFVFPEAAKPVVRAPKPDSPKPAGVLGLGGYAGKTEPMVEHIAPPPPEPAPSPKKIPARFDDMVQQQQKY